MIRLLIVVLAASGCAAVPAYPGPRRPADEVAIIETSELIINRIDRLHIRDGAGHKFEVLPGNHVLLVSLDATKNKILWSEHYTSGLVDICVKAKPKRRYVVRPKIDGTRWEAVITDGDTGKPVPPCGPDDDDDDGTSAEGNDE